MRPQCLGDLICARPFIGLRGTPLVVGIGEAAHRARVVGLALNLVFSKKTSVFFTKSVGWNRSWMRRELVGLRSNKDAHRKGVVFSNLFPAWEI